MTPSDEQIRTLAQQILAQREYARWREHEPVLELWLQKVLGFFERMRDLSVKQPALYWLITGGLLLLAALLMAHVIWSIRIALRAPGSVPRPRPARSTGGSFAAEAEELAARGLYLEAAHQLQLACIDVLLRRGVIELTRSEPNRTLRRRLHEAALPAADRDALLLLLDRLERQWFRDRGESRDLYSEWRALHARLEQLPEAA